MRNDDAHIHLIGIGMVFISSSYFMMYYFPAISLLTMYVGLLFVSVGVSIGLIRSGNTND